METSTCFVVKEALLGEGDVKVRPEVKFKRMVNLHPSDLLFEEAK